MPPPAEMGIKTRVQNVTGLWAKNKIYTQAVCGSMEVLVWSRPVYLTGSICSSSIGLGWTGWCSVPCMALLL